LPEFDPYSFVRAQRWNDTYLHFHKTDPKQTYYLSMEYLQGRALTNAVGNLNITGAYAEAVKKFGYELEALAGQVGFHFSASHPKLDCAFFNHKQEYFLLLVVTLFN
jgi:starch phosphorylase